MSKQRFAEIIEGLCRIYSVDHSRILEGESLDFGGIRFSLCYAEGTLAPLLMMYCDFGTVPKDLETTVYRQLLECNLSTYTGQGETFCMTAEGRVVFVNNYQLDEMTPEVLAGQLNLAAMYAKRWREDYFLPDGEGKAKKTRISSMHSLHRQFAAGKSPS